MALKTPDGRYIVVRERLWRAANPQLPEAERDGHTRALMAARRAVGAALRAQDKAGEKRARARVHRAKVALGERGPVWWEDGAPDQNRRMIGNTEYHEWWQEITRIRATILELLAARREDATICPSEVARAVQTKGWRRLMPAIRDVAREMAREGVIEIRQKGRPVDPDADWRGPIRIAKQEAR